jgi:hypothetical protein
MTHLLLLWGREKPGGSHEEYMQEGNTGKALSKASTKEACSMKAQWHVVPASSSAAGCWELMLSMVGASLLDKQRLMRTVKHCVSARLHAVVLLVAGKCCSRWFLQACLNSR